MERLSSQRGRASRLSPDQIRQLQEALKGLPPSGPEFKAIMQTLKSSGVSNPYEEMQDDGAFSFGAPTLDFMMRDPETDAMLAERRGPISPENVNPGSTGYDFTGKRPEPGNTRPADLGLPSPAEAADKGQTETGLDLGASARLEDLYGGPQPGMSYNRDQMAIDEQSLLDNMNLATGNPDDYAFDDTPLGMRDMIASNPDVYANIMYGDSQIKRETMTPFIQSAGALAAAGVIGPSYSDDLHGGATSSSLRMQAMEDAVNTMDQPGMQFVDPGSIYGQMFDRASNSYDPGDPTSDATKITEQIDLTNEALMNAAPYMAKDASEYLAARLEQARLEYITLIAKGEASMTYPAYLQSIGADKWIQG